MFGTSTFGSSAFGSSVAAGIGTAALKPPSPLLRFHGNMQWASLTGPSPGLLATGRDVTGGNTLSIRPVSPTLSAIGLTGSIGRSSLAAPRPSLIFNGFVNGSASAYLTTRSPLSVAAYSGASASIKPLGRASVMATGLTGAIGLASLKAPKAKVTASGAAIGYGRAHLIAPMPTLGGGAQVRIAAPSAHLVAVGSAVIVVSYEAYAMTIKHEDGVSPNAVTRYAGYPFDRIVRFKNDYFGVGEAGMFLLGGITDDGALIPYDVKTCETDFEIANHKTVERAYFGGRFAPTETVTLHTGAGVPYAYQMTSRSHDPQNSRVLFGKGVKSRYFALEVSGSADIELDTIDFSIGKSTRRI